MNPDKFDIWFEKFTDPYEEELSNTDAIEEEYGDLMSAPTPHQALITPMGILTMRSEILASSEFKFWTGHCNFGITPKIVSIIDQVPGVETLDVWTRYRFRIGIAKLFKDASVMFEVKETVVKYLHDITRKNSS